MEKINTTNKTLARVTKEKSTRPELLKPGKTDEVSLLILPKKKKVKKIYCEQMYPNKFYNLEKKYITRKSYTTKTYSNAYEILE